MRMPFTIILIFVINRVGLSQDTLLKITPLGGDFYVYTTYNMYEGKRIPANGMYVLTEAGAVLLDTPWDTTQFQPLLDSIRIKHNQTVNTCIATHWHSDKTEGLEYYRRQGIKTFTTQRTDEFSRRNNKKRAEFLMAADTVFKVGKIEFETFYPGEAHTADNIVIWFPKEKTLYAGCLVKGVDDETLGNLSDANELEYENTLLQLKAKYPNPRTIIISHNDWSDNRSLDHSIKMAAELKAQRLQQSKTPNGH